MYRDRSTVIRKIVIISALLLILGGGIFALHSVYTVRTVYVEGNVHYTEYEIKEIVMSGPLGNNSLYLSLKYRDRGIQDVPFVDVMNVSILAPDTIKITVYEKALAGYVKYLDTYMYFDKDGYVVESSGIRTQRVPQITGLAFNHIVLGEQHPVENPEVFAGIRSEGEGIRLVKKTAGWLCRQGKPWMVIQLVWQSGWKYLGYLLGKRYQKLPKWVIPRCTMNPKYWE